MSEGIHVDLDLPKGIVDVGTAFISVRRRTASTTITYPPAYVAMPGGGMPGTLAFAGARRPACSGIARRIRRFNARPLGSPHHRHAVRATCPRVRAHGERTNPSRLPARSLRSDPPRCIAIPPWHASSCIPEPGSRSWPRFPGWSARRRRSPLTRVQRKNR